MPKIAVAQDTLLTCGTWYVVEAPPSPLSSTKKLVGCGRFTLQSPTKIEEQSAATARMNIPHLRHFATNPDMARQGIASEIWKHTWQDLCQHYSREYNLPYPPGRLFYIDGGVLLCVIGISNHPKSVDTIGRRLRVSSFAHEARDIERREQQDMKMGRYAKPINPFGIQSCLQHIVSPHNNIVIVTNLLPTYRSSHANSPLGIYIEREN